MGKRKDLGLRSAPSSGAEDRRDCGRCRAGRIHELDLRDAGCRAADVLRRQADRGPLLWDVLLALHRGTAGAVRFRQRPVRNAARHVLCTSCRQPVDDPWSLLAGLAAALNACEDAGYKVVLTGWQAIHTKRGYVLRLKDRRWAARTQDYEPFPVTAGDDVLDDGMDD